MSRQVSMRCYALAITLSLVCAFLAAIIAAPPTSLPFDPDEEPFLGQYDTNSYVIPFRSFTKTQILPHRIMILIAAGCSLLALFAKLRMRFLELLERGSRFFHGLFFTILSSRHRLPVLAWAIFVVGVYGMSFFKIADFRHYDDAQMAVTNNHYMAAFLYADKIATGSILLRETTPKYGILLSSILGLIERQFGLLDVGSVIKIVLASELLLWLAMLQIYRSWARGLWVTLFLPVLLILCFYWSMSTVMVPANHAPLRTGGIFIALYGLHLSRNWQWKSQSFALGALAGIAVLINFESGLPVVVAAGVYGIHRHGEFRWTTIMTMIARCLLGASLVISIYVVGCTLFLPAVPDWSGVVRFLAYSRVTSEGYGSVPINLNRMTYFAFLILGHAFWVVLYSFLNSNRSPRSSFRVFVGMVLIVWMTYFFYRPDPEYLCSYLPIYGLLVIDSGRMLLTAIRSLTRHSWACSRADFVMSVIVLGVTTWYCSQSIHIDLQQQRIQVKSKRWQVPLRYANEIDYGEPVSGIMLPEKYAKAARERAEFLKRNPDHKPIYFTPDAYLMFRLSGIVPPQEYADPGDIVLQASYDKLIHDVVSSQEKELYIDDRDLSKLIWYGRIFQHLKKSLSTDFQYHHSESGWEVWVRRPR